MNANKNTSFTTRSILRIFGIKHILSLSCLLPLTNAAKNSRLPKNPGQATTNPRQTAPARVGGGMEAPSEWKWPGSDRDRINHT